MSLIITGNKLIESGVRDIGVSQSPYHYRNFLKETITLEPHSEVAVQSVKLTKGGGIRISPDDGFYICWNKDLAKLDDGQNIYDTTGIPIWCPIGLTAPDKAEDVSITEFNDRITQAIRKGCPHPDLNYIPSSSLSNRYYPLCDLNYDATTNAFTGFDITFAQNEYDAIVNNVLSLNGTEAKWWYDADDTLVSSVNGANVKINAVPSDNAQAVSDNQIVYTGMPTTFKGGNLRFDLTGVAVDPSTAKWGNETDWAVGLTRSKEKTPTEEPSDVDFTSDGKMPPTKAEPIDNSAGNTQFFDYVIRCTENGNAVRELVLGHMVMKDVAGNSTEMCMEEIKYYDFAAGGSVGAVKLSDGAGGRYNLSTNTDLIKQFLIRVENDVVKFYYNNKAIETADDPLWSMTNFKLFCSYDLYDWSTNNAVNYKTNYPKPVNQTTWWMYPKVYVDPAPFIGGTDKYLELSAYNGVVRSGITNPYFNPVYDWRVDLMSKGDNAILKEIDNRYYNDTANAQTYKYMTIRSQADPYLKEQAWVMILLEDDEYYPNTNLATDEYVASRLGFPNMKIVRPDINGVSVEVGKENSSGNGNEGWEYTSTEVPTLLNSGSLFVRLDNYTQKSLNGAVGRPSKILYTLPAFDITGNSRGQLYFEPNDRVYVKLHNPAPITINTFDISICDENEVLASTLRDQTIVCLHFRDTPKIN